MKVDYEQLNTHIKLIHDVDALNELKYYNCKINKLFYSLIIDDTEKDIFDCFRIFMKYLALLDKIIDNQITHILDDMERSQPADED